MEKNNVSFELVFSSRNLRTYNSNLNSKKAISPIVATSLLLIVAVLAIVGFQSWYTSYQSSMLTNIEIQSNSGINELRIENLIGNFLYIINNLQDNLSISELKIGGNICSITNNLTLGLNEIDISSCTSSLTTSITDVVLVTEKNIVSKTIYIRDSTTTSSLDCSTLNGGDWVKVPGNALYGTTDFCVMKYEAKWNGSGTINNGGSGYCGNGNDYNITTGCSTDGSVGVVSQANDPPLTQVNQFEAIKLCKTLGPNFHLITNNEWMTIARNVETVPSNWADGTIGSTVASGGGLKRGNTGENGNNVGYDSVTDPDRGTGRDEKALLNLTNGEGIWDLSGNVWEWTSDTIDCSGGYSPCVNMPYNSSPPTYGWTELTAIDNYGALSYNLLKPTNSTWDANYGIGRLYTDNDFSWPNDATWNTSHAFLRGGGWNFGAYAGAFALYLYNGPSYASTGFGLRCSYAP